MLIEISNFIDSLKEKPNSNVFNPWFEQDIKNDIGPQAPEIRRRQLSVYLNERIDKARYLFIAEALGYQGGHFTGIAMTSERILLGYQQKKYGVQPKDVFQSLTPERTSKPLVNEKGMTEPTATIMWGVLHSLGICTRKVVLWNALPWHPFNPQKGMLSNRTPSDEEMKSGLHILTKFTSLFPGTKLVAVGRKCEESLEKLSLDYIGVRHPANGGAPQFRKQVRELFL